MNWKVKTQTAVKKTCTIIRNQKSAVPLIKQLLGSLQAGSPHHQHCSVP